MLLAFSVMAQTTAKPAQQPASPTAGSASSEANAPTPPAHPITTAQAHEMMQLTGTDKIKSRLVENITHYFQERFPPFIPEDVKTDLHTSLEKMDVDTGTIAIYQRYLSTEDATKIIAFYKTPAGKDLLEATPKLLGEVQQSALKQGQQTVSTVIERHKAEIQAAQKAYEAKQQKAAPPSLGPPTPGAGGAKPGARPSSPARPPQ